MFHLQNHKPTPSQPNHSFRTLSQIGFDAFQESTVHFMPWALQHIKWDAAKLVLDCGCGASSYLDHAIQQGLCPKNCHVIDKNKTLAREIKQSWSQSPELPQIINGDHSYIPLPDASIDYALAMHIFARLDDISASLAEIRRVLRPDGQLLVSTNSVSHLHELSSLFSQSVKRFSGVSFQYPVSMFSGENGANFLEYHFANIQRHDFSHTIVCQSAQPLISFIEEQRPLLERLLPSTLGWNLVVEDLEYQINIRIKQTGSFKTQIKRCIFLCT